LNVIVCYKVVPEEQDISILPDRTLSLDKVEWKIGQYDLNAVEAGVQIVEKIGGKVSALSVGAKHLDNSKLIKDILSRGPQDLYLVVDNQLGEADTYQTAVSLAEAINKIGTFDLIICGEGSSDLYAQQVGPQLGELLGLPVVNAVSKIESDGNKVIVERTLESEIEVLEITLPAVLCVTTDINLPRIPTMKHILAASKKPVTKWTIAELGIEVGVKPTKIISTLAPQKAERQGIIIEGDSEEAVQKLFNYLCKEIL